MKKNTISQKKVTEKGNEKAQRKISSYFSKTGDEKYRSVLPKKRKSVEVLNSDCLKAVKMSTRDDPGDVFKKTGGPIPTKSEALTVLSAEESLAILHKENVDDVELKASKRNNDVLKHNYIKTPVNKDDSINSKANVKLDETGVPLNSKPQHPSQSVDRLNSFKKLNFSEKINAKTEIHFSKTENQRKGISPLKDKSHNVLLEDDTNIINELIAAEATASRTTTLETKKISPKNEIRKKTSISRNLSCGRKSDALDDKLLNNLIEKDDNVTENEIVEEYSEASISWDNTADSSLLSCERKENCTAGKSETHELDDLNDFFEDNWGNEHECTLDLSSLQRCEIVDVIVGKRETIITAKETDSKAVATVACSGFWRDGIPEKGQTVTICADRQSDGWIIDNNHGLIISYPDTLVSGTSVVGGLFCARRGVLNEKFRGIDSLPTCQGDSSCMTVGSLVHILLQKALRNDIRKVSDIETILEEVLDSWHVIYDLYASGMTLDDCRKLVDPYVPKIFDFIERYIKGKRPRGADNNFQGKINTVQDIEENIWLPKLGIKGKIDVTVEVNINERRKIMPLELKTGRTSFSLEHKGQVILYTIMMTHTGRDVDTGLLLYLRDNVMQEIKSTHHERRDLLLLRNNLARYLTRERQSDDESSELPELMKLPEPINHHSACSKCSYKNLCCVYLSRDKATRLSEKHPLNAIRKEVLECLKPKHVDYFIKWVYLLQVEAEAQNDGSSLKDMWTLKPEQRAKEGKCLSNLVVTGRVVEECGRYPHTFIRSDKTDVVTNDDFTQTNFNEQEYVIVSTNTRTNISSGFLIYLSKDSVVILLDRDITKINSNELFHVDTYTSSNLLSYNLVNVAGLLDDNPISERLRKIVIDRSPATFAADITRAVAATGADVLRGLNKPQQKAVLGVLSANEYVLVKGMPGTGKTRTLVALVELLAKLGKSVLITSHTNSAVDNVLLKLVERNVDFLRLGSAAKINSALKHKCEKFLTENCRTPESLDTAYNSKNIIGVTCFGSHHPLLGKRTFDVCVVDESTQVLQATILRPLYSASKFVLIGDPNQLSPVVKSAEARKLGMNESLFARLDSKNNTVDLVLQYRMNSRIMSVANDLSYNGQLQAGNDEVANATLRVKDASILDSCERWAREALSVKLDDSMIVLDTGATRSLKLKSVSSDSLHEDGTRCTNLWEAAIVLRLVTCLLEAGLQAEGIGVVSPYRAQVSLLKRITRHSVEINTVDQYQGRDKDVILYSCTKSSTSKDPKRKGRDYDILDDHERLTVAITRAKFKLIMIGDKGSLLQFAPFQKLFSVIREKDVVKLTEGQKDFSWEKLVEKTKLASYFS